MDKINKILVIGGTGFIGAYVVDNLITRPGLDIHLIHSESLPGGSEKPGITYHKMDLSAATGALKELIRGCDCVVSLATPNLRLVENLVASVGGSKVKKIVYTSSMLVYPDSEQLHTEETAPRPITEYEISKVAEENVLINFAESSGIKVCITRLGNVYGDIKNRGLIGCIMHALITDSPLTINGNGEHRRSYIFVQDVANLLEFSIFNDQRLKLEVFNVCTEQNYTINQVIDVVERISEKKIEKYYGAPIIEKLSVVGSNKKIIDLSSYKFKHDLASGLQKTYHNYLAKGSNK